MTSAEATADTAAKMTAAAMLFKIVFMVRIAFWVKVEWDGKVNGGPGPMPGPSRLSRENQALRRRMYATAAKAPMPNRIIVEGSGTAAKLELWLMTAHAVWVAGSTP